MIFAIILVAIGLLRKQSRDYWIAAATAVGVQFVVALLFHGKTGLLTPALREATGDGPAMAVIAIGIMVLAWVVPIAIAARGYKRKTPPKS